MGHLQDKHTDGSAGRRFARASGILLHPTSLPSAHGIGDLGPAAFRFVDFLAGSTQSLWQVLPLNPVGFGFSPYAAPSAFAGNPMLISLDGLVEMDLLSPNDLVSPPRFPAVRVDYERVRRYKRPLYQKAFRRFQEFRHSYDDEYAAFADQHAQWLDDYALFMALKEAHGGTAWTDWQPDIARRDSAAIDDRAKDLGDEIRFHHFLQFIFHRQWASLKQFANAKGIRIVGDLPIFVAHDSVDVWANRHLFFLDDGGRPTVVAGVPPDYFSPTGQRWGNPLYRWGRMAEHGYDWWIARFRRLVELVDAVRLDHFRGFQAYWEVPAEHETAQHGRWVLGPGEPFFGALEAALGPLPIIVEDLGLITPDVEELREQLGYPGMKVLQFAFGGDSANPYLPHNYEHHCVVYTATHDNDTTAGWFGTATPNERHALQTYLGTSPREVAWDFIRLALSSVADTAIVPLQDVLALGASARMNFPGHATGNWNWRYAAPQLTQEHVEKLAALTMLTGRAL